MPQAHSISTSTIQTKSVHVRFKIKDGIKHLCVVSQMETKEQTRNIVINHNISVLRNSVTSLEVTTNAVWPLI